MGVEFAKQIDSWDGFDEFWLVARRKDKLDALSKKLKHPAKILPVDLSNQAGVADLINQLPGHHVFLLVNNAGFGKHTPFSQTASEINDQMAYLNMLTPMQLIQACLPYMSAGSGIINVASTAGFIPLANFTLYSATKAFLLHFSLSLRVELYSRGITVLAVCPGPVATEFGLVASDGKDTSNWGADPAEVVKLALIDYKGRALSIYGWQYKFLLLVVKLLPKSLLAWGTRRLS